MINKENYNEYPELYYEIPKTELKYYTDELLNNIKYMDINNREVSINVNKVLKEDPKTKKNTIEHFVTVIQDYFVQQGI